ncbi:S-norcoclaurine synthase 1-like [Corylus avellana]|uniref:S-norcoclaurine synthase 1-like n=1 Tax=Corylus avellana TaxID=13451 RepID=UPI00286C18A2|nr:S-norcoclaurine synthase 1-like [Corylus avellana]
MAADLSATAASDLPKSVQEMSINGSEPPQEYIVKDATFGSVVSSPPLGSIPIINISLFLPSSSHDAEHVENELQKLRSALSSSGCFQAIGHGISSSFLDKVRGVAKQFFSLPVEEKQKYSRAVNESEGYGNDVIVSEKQVLDWSYRLTQRVFPEDRRRLNLWAENPTDFGPHQVLGVKPHTDRSGVTVLLQDGEVEGLQVLIEDKWVRVPIVPHALLVNLGEQMQIMSNGIFKSTPMHRVVTNTEKMRMSVAMFNEPQPNREIGPVGCLIDEKRPRLCRNVTNYSAINYECFQKGKIALETVRI